MKKAICIKKGEWHDILDDSIIKNAPKFGEPVTIAGQCPIFPNGWDILEYPLNDHGMRQSLAKDHFILTSDIDEIELAEQREQLQTV